MLSSGNESSALASPVAPVGHPAPQEPRNQGHNCKGVSPKTTCGRGHSFGAALARPCDRSGSGQRQFTPPGRRGPGTDGRAVSRRHTQLHCPHCLQTQLGRGFKINNLLHYTYLLSYLLTTKITFVKITQSRSTERNESPSLAATLRSPSHRQRDRQQHAVSLPLPLCP